MGMERDGRTSVRGCERVDTCVHFHFQFFEEAFAFAYMFDDVFFLARLLSFWWPSFILHWLGPLPRLFPPSFTFFCLIRHPAVIYRVPSAMFCFSPIERKGTCSSNKTLTFFAGRSCRCSLPAASACPSPPIRSSTSLTSSPPHIRPHPMLRRRRSGPLAVISTRNMDGEIGPC
jgi:hypothetical protein